MQKLSRIWLLGAVLGLAAMPGAYAQTVVASTDGESSGVRLDVTELKRSSGNTLTLKFTIVNASDDRFGFGYDMGDKDFNDFSNVGGVHLIDAANKKKYLVVRDSQKNCVCSSKLKDIQPGKSLNLWAKFPAPPETVQAISIVVPHFIPLDDVPIGQ